MHFGNLRELSEYIGKDRILEKCFGCLPENAGCIPSAVVKMTTADGIYQAFSGRHSEKYIFSYLYRVDTEISEVNADIARRPSYPCYLKYDPLAIRYYLSLVKSPR